MNHAPNRKRDLWSDLAERERVSCAPVFLFVGVEVVVAALVALGIAWRWI